MAINYFNSIAQCIPPEMISILMLLFVASVWAGSNRVPRLYEDNATVDGLTLHYRIGGSGPCLLMLHGFTLSGEQWMSFANDFLTSHTVIIVDLPGHGGSSPLPGPFSFEKSAQLMHGLLDELGMQEVSGIGHSAGAMTLLHMAAQNPLRMDALVLVDGPCSFGPEARKFIREDTFELLAPGVQEFYRRIHPGGQTQVDQIFRQYYGLADNYEEVPPEALATLPVRTMLVWGENDPCFPIEIPLEMYRAMPEAALWVIPEQGHAPLWVDLGGDADVADLFVEVTKNFLIGEMVGITVE